MADIHVSTPIIRILDNGDVYLRNVESCERIHYTTDGTSPTRDSKYVDGKTYTNDSRYIGNFPKGTVIKAFQSTYVTHWTEDSKGNQSDKVTELIDSNIVSETVLEPNNLDIHIQFVDASSTQRYVYLTGNNIALGSLYVTFDGSDPRNNGVIWNHAGYGTNDSDYWVGWETLNNYKCRVILRYGTYYSNEIEFTKGDTTFDILPPIITYDSIKNYTSITNPNPESLGTVLQYKYQLADGTEKEWINSNRNITNSIFSTTVKSVTARCVKPIPAAPKYNEVTYVYSSEVTQILGVNAPTITQDVKYNKINIEKPEGHKVYYTIDGTTPTETSTEYTEPISAKGLAEGTIIKAISTRKVGDTIRTSDVVSYAFTLHVLQPPTIKFNVNTCTMVENNTLGVIKYTTDGSTPTINSEQFTIGFILNESLTVKAKVFYEVEGTVYYSDVTSVYYDYISETENKPYIALTGSEDVAISHSDIKPYVDIIFTDSYEIPKVLNCITYIINAITEQFGIVNPAEEVLDRTFQGDYILIYSDQTYTGILELSTSEPINSLNNYKYPYYEKGKWNFNFFRNNITSPVTEEELEGYTSFLYYNPETKKNEVRNISLAQLKNANRFVSATDIADMSDNRSLIYGKYFVTRFIFNNDKKIKLETVDIMIQKY